MKCTSCTGWRGSVLTLTILGFASFLLASAPDTFRESVSTEKAADSRVAELGAEVREKGWIVCGAKTDRGDWDLFLLRPDGSKLRNITNTPDWSEAAPRFSPDGSRLLYRRLKKGQKIHHDRWGFQGEPVMANSDGTEPVVLGKKDEFTWAGWGPDGRQVSCLSLQGIEIMDLKTRHVVRKFPRQGMFQQLTWSPDGKWFCGTANVGGENWTILRMDATDGQSNVVSKYRNCTPDWFPDSKRVIFSNRAAGQAGYGWTQLWMADGAGKSRSLVYGEDTRHIYGGALSPDAEYVLFTRCPKDGGGSQRRGAPGGLMRLRDAPIIGGASEALRKVHPDANDGPVLPLPFCWEPHWTYAQIGEPE